MSVRILTGDCRAVLASLPDESVHCVVTSPPYFGLRDYGHAGQIGLEDTPDAFVATMVEVFREVRRVLRRDGTLWLNLGDSYGAGKQLQGTPWRVAFALQADGWWLRQDIIWAKSNPMPESVRDRCTKSHEYVFLLTKSERYFYDIEAVREPEKETSGEGMRPPKLGPERLSEGYANAQARKTYDVIKGANRRSVWTIATQPFSEAHFATFPPELPELCIKAGTSEGGCCPHCGAGWTRDFSSRTGWIPSCSCLHAYSVPATVLDPFGGAGTTALVADRLGRNAILVELNQTYADMARKRIEGDAGLFASVAAE